MMLRDRIQCLAANERNMHAIKDVLTEIADGLSGTIGPEFFAALVMHLAKGCDVKFSLIAKVDDLEQQSLTTMAAYDNGRLIKRFSYGLSGAACEIVLQQGKYYCDSGLATCFPASSAISNNYYDSYLGVALNSPEGDRLGVLVLMNDQSIENSDTTLQLMRIFAGRTAAELMRLTSEYNNKVLMHELQLAHRMEAVGMLAGGIAHDFNNILASILGFSDLALRNLNKQQDDKLYRYMQEVHKAGERARDLVAQLLLFSRGTAGKPKPASLAPMVKETVQLLRASLPAMIEFHEQYQEQLPLANIDVVLVQRVLTNIIVNARDAIAETGCIEVTVSQVKCSSDWYCSSCHQPINGDFVQVLISDNGHGIDKTELDRIFDPFFSSRDIGEGRGLGLSVVHGIMHDIGGHVLVESQVGQGTVFHLLFAVTPPAQVNAAGLEPPSPRVRQLSAAGKIIIVDDEMAMTRFLSELFNSQGYTVEVYNLPHQVLEALRASAQDYVLLLTDQTMPGMTGLELVKQAKAIKSELCCILCSGVDEGDVAQSLAELDGSCRFIQKPIANDLLLVTVNELIGTGCIQPPVR